MFSMAAASLFRPFLPLLPKQILFMNLLTMGVVLVLPFSPVASLLGFSAPLPGILFSVLLAILIPYVLLTGKLKTRVGLQGSFHPS